MSFLKTENCPVCGKTINVLEKALLTIDGKYVCNSCFDAIVVKEGVPLHQVRKYSAEELRHFIGKGPLMTKEHQAAMNAFQITKRVGDNFLLDECNKMFAIPTEVGFFGQIKNMEIHHYTDIIKYELLETGNQVSKGGVGRAIIGGALFGDVGAIVGGTTGHKNKSTCNSMKIKITIKDMQNPYLYINLLTIEARGDSPVYGHAMKRAQEILSILEIISHQESHRIQEEEQVEPTPVSGANEIRAYKELLDEGIISQEEFEAKKKQILGL